MKVTCSVKNLDGMLSSLNGYKDRILSGCHTAAAELAEITQTTAQRLVPVKTGALRDSISTAAQQTSLGAVAVVTVGEHYGAYVEYGTGPRGQLSPSARPGVTYRTTPWTYVDMEGHFHRTSGMPARPFFYPAFLECERRMESVVKSHIRGVL